MNALNQFEIVILEFLQRHSCETLDTLIPYVTYIFEKNFLSYLLVVIFLCFKKTRKTGFVLILAVVLGHIIVNMTLKPVFARMRPYDFKPIENMLIDKTGGYSFPSGHTLVAFETAMSVYLYKRKWGTLLFLLAVVVGFSRMYLYMHYPTDVLAGALIGMLIAYMSYKIVTMLCEKYKGCD